MSNIVNFSPKSEKDIADNLHQFILLCRDELTVFGKDLDWSASTWPSIAVFSKMGVKTRSPKQGDCLDSAFVDFAKAYLRYQQGHKPTKTKNETKALRAVEAALIQLTGTARIQDITLNVLDESASMARAHYGGGAAYHCGRELERLAKFLADKKLAHGRISAWVSPLRRVCDTTRTGREARRIREKRLPNETALNAIAEIFSNHPTDPRDVFTTSVFAMLMAAPSRISEVLALPVDCEHFETESSTNCSAPEERYGWRFYSAKGYEGDIKWIPTPMVSVAKEAIRRVRALTVEARSFAKWVEENPGKFYRHQDCPNVNEDAPLTMAEACKALGLHSGTKKACRTSLRNRGLASMDGVHTLASLWEHVLSRLPDGFPWFDEEKGIKYSEALFVFNKHQFHGNRGSLPVELHKPTNNFFNNDLSPRDGVLCHRSIFDRNGYRLPDGRRLKVTSHQARHLLNTIAQRGGLSNLEIAKWSGRADPKQNRTYNHMSDYEFLAVIDSADPSRSMFGPADEPGVNAPAASLSFDPSVRAAAHVTEYGFCIHDYTISPCEKYRNCVNCSEHVCVKGDIEKLARIKKRLETTERLCESAEKAMQSGAVGADRWYQHHKKTLVRLRELVTILQDDNVEDGAMVKLKGSDFSQLDRVMEKTSAGIEELTNGSADMPVKTGRVIGHG